LPEPEPDIEQKQEEDKFKSPIRQTGISNKIEDKPHREEISSEKQSERGGDNAKNAEIPVHTEDHVGDHAEEHIGEHVPVQIQIQAQQNKENIQESSIIANKNADLFSEKLKALIAEIESCKDHINNDLDNSKNQILESEVKDCEMEYQNSLDAIQNCSIAVPSEEEEFEYGKLREDNQRKLQEISEVQLEIQKLSASEQMKEEIDLKMKKVILI